MNKNVIEVTPDSEGKLYIKLYGTRYEIVVKSQGKTGEKPAKN